MSATELPEIIQLVLNIELLAISSMSEVRNKHKVCFGLSIFDIKTSISNRCKFVGDTVEHLFYSLLLFSKSF